VNLPFKELDTYQRISLVEILRSLSFFFLQRPQIFAAPKVVATIEDNIGCSLRQQLQTTLKLLDDNRQRMRERNFDLRS
jgi:hypothetical protein